MLNHNSQVFRVKYEAFSKFSNNLSSCRNFEEVAECFSVNLKYLFNFHVFRASYQHNDFFVHLTCTSTATNLKNETHSNYLGYEETVIGANRPLQWTDLSLLQLPGEFNIAGDEEPRLGAWNFVNKNRQIVVSVLSGKTKVFSHKDINFLKLVSENLETKLLEICLIKELDLKNAIISEVNERQKEIIAERTKELAEKNKVLLEISMLNAHSVREPLARILGLVELVEPGSSKEEVNEIIPFLKRSATDLDSALRNVIKRTTDDLLKLKA